MAMIGKVKRMHFREKKSVREIVRLTSLSRNTVRKWLKAPVAQEPKYKRGEAPGKLTPFHGAIKRRTAPSWASMIGWEWPAIPQAQTSARCMRSGCATTGRCACNGSA